MTTWPTNWTRIPTLSLRNHALHNAQRAAAECARRRREREEVDAYLASRAPAVPPGRAPVAAGR